MVKIAFFDVDGTVLNKQLPLLFVDYLQSNDIEFRGENHTERIQLEKNLQILRLKYKNLNRDADFVEYSVALVEYMMLRLQGYSGVEVRELAKAALHNVEAEAYHFSLMLIDELRRQGYSLVAISGSPQILVDKFVDAFGFDEGIGQKYEKVGGESCHKPAGATTYKDKHKIISVYLKEKYTELTRDDFRIISIGDTEGDFEMLECGCLGIAINPSRGLLAEIANSNNKIVLATERKGVVMISRLGDILLGQGNEIWTMCSGFLLEEESIRAQIKELIEPH